jgi:hypothetical protein
LIAHLIREPMEHVGSHDAGRTFAREEEIASATQN